MTIRTSERTVTFTRPFVLGESAEVFPPGAYKVETDEQLLDGVSFVAYRRVLTFIHLHPIPGRPGLTQMLKVDPQDLTAAILRDQDPAPAACGADHAEPNG